MYLVGLVAETGGSCGRGNQPGGGVFGPNARSGLFCVEWLLVGSLLVGLCPDGVEVCAGGRDGLVLCVDGAVDCVGSEVDWTGDSLALCVGSDGSDDVAEGLVPAIAVGAAMPASARPAERAAAWRVRSTHVAMLTFRRECRVLFSRGAMPRDTAPGGGMG